LLPFSPELLSSHLLREDTKIRIYKIIISPEVLRGCETWCTTLKDEYRLRMFENRVLRKISVPKRDEVMEDGENCITRSFMICTHCKV
jgi:hypothetical protein